MYMFFFTAYNVLLSEYV